MRRDFIDRQGSAFQRMIKPELFQIRHRKANYFEGWYYKQVAEDQRHSIALIPGLSLDTENPHAFVQVILYSDMHNSLEESHSAKPTLTTHYFKFPIEDFHYQDEPFEIQIGDNRFSKTELRLDLNKEGVSIAGHFTFGDFLALERSLTSPNIMGGFAYLSFMECYHGIVSMRHDCAGRLSINGEAIDFSGGKGYIEKDWGRSFPKEYVWVQCNHFKQAGTALMLSVAHIPFLGTAFKGFICNVIIKGKEYRFATYNGAKIIKEEVGSKQVLVELLGRNHRLEIRAEVAENGVLIAPKDGQMNHAIKEGLTGVVALKLMDRNGLILYEDRGTSAGVEIVR